jgi:putative DNA primase/helicase
MTTFDPRAAAREAFQHGSKKPNGAAPKELDLVWADDIAIDIDKPGLVDGLLSSTAMTVAYGESGSGKTFVIVDLSCRIAASLPWRDHPTEQGVVVYIAAEAPKSVERRVWAWKHHHGIDRLPLVIVRSTVNLLDGDTDPIIATLAEIKAKRGHIALVMIDTLARAMVGNENAPEDMGGFVAACGRIREAADTSILIVHHTGKDQAKGARGWSGLRAATDVEIEITEGCIKVSKNRDGQEGQTYGFKLEQVELGENRKGRMATTCVAVETEPPVGSGKKRKLGPNEQILFDALVTAIAEQPDTPPPSPQVPSHVKGATVPRWRETAALRMTQAEPKQRNRAMDRAITSLVASQHVCHFAGFAWLP